MQTLKKQIQLLIQSNPLPSGIPGYFPSHESDTTFGDESGNHILIYAEQNNQETHDNPDILSKLNKKLMQLTPDSLKNLKLIHNTGLLKIWVSEHQDTFTIQISDNHIHFITHYSGQY